MLARTHTLTWNHSRTLSIFFFSPSRSPLSPCELLCLRQPWWTSAVVFLMMPILYCVFAGLHMLLIVLSRDETFQEQIELRFTFKSHTQNNPNPVLGLYTLRTLTWHWCFQYDASMTLWNNVTTGAAVSILVTFPLYLSITYSFNAHTKAFPPGWTVPPRRENTHNATQC